MGLKKNLICAIHTSILTTITGFFSLWGIMKVAEKQKNKYRL